MGLKTNAKNMPPHKLSKRQSHPRTVLLRKTPTRTINQLQTRIILQRRRMNNELAKQHVTRTLINQSWWKKAGRHRNIKLF